MEIGAILWSSTGRLSKLSVIRVRWYWDRSLVEIIIPLAMRKRHNRGLARYSQTGTGETIGHRIEMDEHVTKPIGLSVMGDILIRFVKLPH